MLKYFDNIIGNDKLKKLLTGYFNTKSLPHAFIIEGAVGSGRKHIAKSIAAAISCKHEITDVVPCLKCINCEKIFREVSPDVILIDSGDKSTIGVELIRELSSHTYISPNELDLKIYIINEADKMTVAAQNAFLKTLEEPVTDVMYFLICENSQMLLPTIISRAPVIRTSPLSKSDLFHFLKNKIPSNADVDEIVALSDKRMGIALNYINDEEALTEKRQVRENIYKFLDLFTQKTQKSDIFSYFSDYSDRNNAEIERLRLLYCAFRDIIFYKEAKSDNFDFFINNQDISKYTNYIKPKFAKRMTILIEKTINELYLNQGNSSLSSIMFRLSTETWNAKH